MKRTIVLSASLGLLALSAVPNPETIGTQLGAVLGLSNGNQAAHVAVPSEADTQFEMLSATYAPGAVASADPTATPVELDESTLWLARAVYSETKLPHEQELVAWVVRNRVETGFRGKSTYRSVVLDPYQFSAFNPESAKRSFLLHLTPESNLSAWHQALWIAHYVRHADPAYRPFSIETRHFYSEQSMRGRTAPYWADGFHFVSPGWDFSVNARRFRFYEELS